MPTYKLMQSITHALSLMLGSAGVFCLWASFQVPHFAMDAILLLTAASALALLPSMGKKK